MGLQAVRTPLRLKLFRDMTCGGVSTTP